MNVVNSDDGSQEWTTVITACYSRRLRPEQVAAAVRELAKRQTPQCRNGAIPRIKFARIIITSSFQARTGVDPLLPGYLQLFIQLQLLEPGAILHCLLALSQYASPDLSHGHDLQKASPALQAGVLALLARTYAVSDRSVNWQESMRTCRALAAWLKACNTYETMLQMDAEGLHVPENGLVAVFEALGTFGVMLFSNVLVKEHLTRSWPEDERSRLGEALGHFAATLSQWSTSQVAPRLQTLVRTLPIADADSAAIFTMNEFLNAVDDLPLATTRVGLYVFLNASLSARPAADDGTILSYLSARYPADVQSRLTDLVVASFDALANALHRYESPHAVECYRSFIVNKVPLLLSILSTGLYPPLRAQFCIQMALGRISIHPYPPLSSDNEIMNDTLRDSKLEFLLACQLHGLVSQDVVSGMLDQQTVPSLPRGGRYVKETLVTQCMGNIHRAEELSGELGQMQGNAGAISAALAEVLQRLCEAKETMSLRTLCVTLARRLPSMDIILQYASLSSMLLPLCNLLNDWTHDEDQSEYQPLYEEFAAVLLLVLALVHRYDLNPADIPTNNNNGFVQRLIRSQSKTIPGDEMTEEQNTQLQKWVQGLYVTDDQGETTGISDETMSHCPPQAFYLLVPTLFEQSVQACTHNAMDVNTMKGGLEFLLEPFLLPSLVGGLIWLYHHSWEDHGDAEILIQVLQKLVQPASISGDAKAMHKAILSIVARTLEDSLQDLNRRTPNRKDIVSLIDCLKPHVNSQRLAKSSQEMKEWTTTPDGGIRRCITNLIDGLVAWGSQADLNPIPKSYTHGVLTAALDLLGSNEVLPVILKAVTKHTNLGAGPSALEVATALICAPSAKGLGPSTVFDTAQSATPGMRSLKQLLRARLEDVPALLDSTRDDVEALVRLGRLVDAQSAVLQVQLPMPTLSNIGTQELMQGIEMVTADVSLQQAADGVDATADFSASLGQPLDASASSAVDLTSMSTATGMQMDLSDNLFASGQDLSFDLRGGLNLGTTSQQQGQQGQQQLGSQSATQSTNDDDIFAGLDFGPMGDDDFNF